MSNCKSDKLPVYCIDFAISQLLIKNKYEKDQDKSHFNHFGHNHKKYIISQDITGLMTTQLAEVEITKDGDIYLARIILPSGEVVNLENEDFEEVLEQVANDLQERFSD